MRGGFFRPRPVPAARPPRPAQERDRAERFRTVMLPHMDAAYTLARYLTRDPSLAEDIVQDAFLRAYRGFGGWRGEAPKPWLLTIVRNCFLTHVSARRGGGMQPIDDLAADPPPQLVEQVDPESLLTDKSEAALLRATIEQLPEPFRETLVLRELEEMSYKDIAAITRVPIGTVMSRLSRAREMLGDLLLPPRNTAREARS